MDSKNTHGFYAGERPSVQSDDHILLRLADENHVSPLLTPGLEQLTRTYTEAISEATPKGGLITEIGIGTGASIEPLLSMRPDIYIIGVDMNEDRLERSKVRLSQHLNRVTLIKSDAVTYLEGLDANSENVISSANTLHNLTLPEREEILHTAFKKIRPGGSFIDFDKHHARDAELAGKDFAERMEHFMDVFKDEPKNLHGWMRHYSRDLVIGQSIEDYEDLLSAIGFDVVKRISLQGLEVIIKATKS